MSSSSSATSAEIRASLTHPVIDSDGHILEFQPAAMTYLQDIAGASTVARYQAWQMRIAPTAEQRIDEQLMRTPFWNFQTRNTLDRATASLPGLMRERMEELGFDFMVLYPTMGLIANEVDDDEVRPAVCRAFNMYNAEICAEFRDRMTPAAVIPMHTPEEAVAELEHCVRQLGSKVVMLASHVRRPIPAAARLGPEALRFGYWFDTYGSDSPHDYDPVWRKCIELGVSPTFHTGTQGTGSRRSRSNYVHNHIGHFAAAGEAICRSLFLSGVTRRFPQLRFGFLEGGVGWGCSLYADIIGHWEKRNREALENYNPERLDRALFEELYRKYAPEMLRRRMRGSPTEEPEVLSAREEPSSLDDFAACQIARAEDIRELFVPSFYFGCEADDPMTAWAFRTDLNPFGARLNTLFGSDVGHWDVAEMRGVLCEAHEMLEDGHVSSDDFRDFVFGNAARFWTALNPDFFRETAVEREVEAFLADAGRKKV
jgi:predicted TIM-barrel fold metal-dependent hydrolase